MCACCAWTSSTWCAIRRLTCFRIASNLAYELELNRRRERARLDTAPVTEELDRLTPLSLEEQTDLSAHLARLNKVMERLRQEPHGLILHRRDGMTYDEIARRMGTSVHMVKKYITGGLELCRTRMGISTTSLRSRP